MTFSKVLLGAAMVNKAKLDFRLKKGTEGGAVWFGEIDSGWTRKRHVKFVD